MKRPAIRVTKWLNDIPVEGSCTGCAGVSFKAKGTSHRPNRTEYQNSLQQQFDEHIKLAHSDSEARTAE